MGDFNVSCVVGKRVLRESIPTEITKNFNRPSSEIVYPDWEVGLKVFFYIIAIILDVVGNSIVIAIIALNRKMRTTTNVLILNLAISDLMVGIFCMWAHMGNQITTDWPFGAFMCKFTTFTQVFSVNASVLTLTVISLERFIAIVFPFKGHWSPITTGVIIVLTWLVSIAMAAPNLFTKTHIVIPWKDSTEVYCADEWPRYYKNEACELWAPGRIIYYSIQGIVMYFLPIAVMIIAYSIIVYKLITRKAPGSHISSAASAQEKTKRKVTTMLIVVLVVFIFCWTPQNTFLLWDLFKEDGESPSYVASLRYFALFIAYFNSALNPILYCGFNENFRKGFLEAFKCILIQKRNKIGPESVAPKSFFRPTGKGIQQGISRTGASQSARKKTTGGQFPDGDGEDPHPNPDGQALHSSSNTNNQSVHPTSDGEGHHPKSIISNQYISDVTAIEKHRRGLSDPSSCAPTNKLSQDKQNIVDFKMSTVPEETIEFKYEHPKDDENPKDDEHLKDNGSNKDEIIKKENLKDESNC